MGAGHSDLSAQQRESMGQAYGGRSLPQEPFDRAASANSISNFKNRAKNILNRSPRQPNASRSMIGPRNLLSGMGSPMQGMNYGGYGGGFNQGYGQQYGGGYGPPQYGPPQYGPPAPYMGGGGYGGGYGPSYGGGPSYPGGYGYSPPGGMYGGGYGGYGQMGGGYPQRAAYPPQGQYTQQQMNYILSNLFQKAQPTQKTQGIKYPGLVNNFMSSFKNDPERVRAYLNAITGGTELGPDAGTIPPVVDDIPPVVGDIPPVVGDITPPPPPFTGMDEGSWAGVGSTDAMAANYLLNNPASSPLVSGNEPGGDRGPLTPDAVFPGPGTGMGQRGRGRRQGGLTSQDIIEATAPIVPGMSGPGTGMGQRGRGRRPGRLTNRDIAAPIAPNFDDLGSSVYGAPLGTTTPIDANLGSSVYGAPLGITTPTAAANIGSSVYGAPLGLGLPANVSIPGIPGIGSLPGGNPLAIPGMPGIGSLPGGNPLAIPGIPGLGSLPGSVPQSVVAPTFGGRGTGMGQRRRGWRG